MKYFFDTEFIEGFHKPFFGKRRHFIDLISIGIACEDHSCFYAISNEFDIELAWNSFDLKPDIDKGGMKKVYWLRENVLKPLYFDCLRRKESKSFVNSRSEYEQVTMYDLKGCIRKYGKSNDNIAKDIINYIGKDNPEFYAYYADYDWVVFCSLFGRMIELPKGFPMMCFDLQQLIEDNKIDKKLLLKEIPQINNCHNALDDAKWNKRLYEFIKSI